VVDLDVAEDEVIVVEETAEEAVGADEEAATRTRKNGSLSPSSEDSFAKERFVLLKRFSSSLSPSRSIRLLTSSWALPSRMK